MIYLIGKRLDSQLREDPPEERTGERKTWLCRTDSDGILRQLRGVSAKQIGVVGSDTIETASISASASAGLLALTEYRPDGGNCRDQPDYGEGRTNSLSLLYTEPVRQK